MNMQTIQNANDLQILYQPLSLYLKPTANLSITITLPSNVTGKNISNFEVMDKLRQMVLPDNFSLLKVSKTTLELLRFDGELDDRNKLKNVILRLDGRQIKLTGFVDYVKVRAIEAKQDFPTRHDWDCFFRDAKNMDEMKSGERPDTVYLSNLPHRWFCPRHHENDEAVKPSESLFKRIFEKFGEVRFVDIPVCDPYRDQMKSALTGIKSLSFDNETYFEGYVQFTEYSSFVRCMDEFRGMKLVRKDADKMVAVNIQVQFDKTKHLSDVSIKRRKVIREHLMDKDREKVAEEEKKIAAEREKLEKIKKKEEVRRQIQLERQKQREERRKQKNIKKITETESSDLTKKIIREQKKLLKAQRKIESIRLLEALFSRLEKKLPPDEPEEEGPSRGFKGFDLRKKLKKKKAKKDNKKDDDSVSLSSVSSADSSKKKSKKRRDSSASSSSSSSSSNVSNHRRKPAPPKQPMVPPNGHMFPTSGWIPTETGDWLPASYMYASPFFAPPGMMAPRPYFNPNYRGGNYRGRGRGRGRYYDGRYRDDYRDHDYRRSYSRSPRRRAHSRSRSRSRSRRRRSYSRSSSRSKSRSRSRSKSRHNNRTKSRSSRSKSREKSKPKLVTTLRDGDINKPPPTTRKSRSRSSTSGGGWSTDNGNHKRSKKTRRDWSRSTSPLIPLSEARAIRKAAVKAVNKEYAETLKAEELRLKQKDKDLVAEAAEIEKRMEDEANGNIHLYSPDNTASHTPPRIAQKDPEKSPNITPPINDTEPINEIFTNEEVIVAS